MLGPLTRPLEAKSFGLADTWTRPSFDLILASARMGAGSNLLCENSGGKPYGVVDTESRLQKWLLVSEHAYLGQSCSAFAQVFHSATIGLCPCPCTHPHLQHAPVCLRMSMPERTLCAAASALGQNGKKTSRTETTGSSTNS